MIYLSQIKQNRFSKKDEYAIIFMQAPLGTQIQVKLYQIDANTQTEQIIRSRSMSFDKQILTRKISLDPLPLGTYSITCEINNVLWASTRFEVIQ